MDKVAVKNMVRIAQELLETEPEMSKQIIKNLRGLIEEHRIASDLKNSVLEAPAANLVSLLKTLKKEASHPSGGDSTASESDDLDIDLINKFLKMAEDAVRENKEATVKEIFGSGASKDLVEVIDMMNAALNEDQIKKMLTKKIASNPSHVSVDTLVRVAFAHPETRPVLLPIIAAKTKKKTKAKPSVKSSKKMVDEKKTSSKKKSEVPAKASKKPTKKSSKRKASIQLDMSDSNW